MPIPDSELCDRYERLYPEAVTDSLSTSATSIECCRARSIRWLTTCSWRGSRTRCLDGPTPTPTTTPISVGSSGCSAKSRNTASSPTKSVTRKPPTSANSPRPRSKHRAVVARSSTAGHAMFDTSSIRSFPCSHSIARRPMRRHAGGLRSGTSRSESAMSRSVPATCSSAMSMASCVCSPNCPRGRTRSRRDDRRYRKRSPNGR